MTGWEALGIFTLGVFAGVALRELADRLARSSTKLEEDLPHVIHVVQNRTNDGARLLGEIEDEVDELHRYGVGSDTRPEIHFHQGA